MTSLRVLPSEIAWAPWGADAFARARVERKPVLLCVATTWSEACDHMDRTSYADPATAWLINDAFVPIRVDADRRPDISDRYALGGWPTTAFLTAEGDVLGGGTYVDAERLPRVLDEVRGAFQLASGAESAENVRLRAEDRRRTAGQDASSRWPPSSDGGVGDLRAQIFDTYDDEYGGFGAAAKFPHAAALHLALRRRADDPRLERIVTTTLDAMGWGGLYDEVAGGFFRCAATRDWRHALREKTLDVNAQLLRIYVDAAEALGLARFGERAAGVLRYAQETLADPEGGWYGSAAPGDRGVDRVLFADANAAMVSSVLRAAAVFDDGALRDVALRSLERVLLAGYRPGHGVAHYYDGRPRVRGLLGDQVAMAAAHLDAFEATGDLVYEMMAEELAHYAVRELWDATGGGFFDRVGGEGDVGLLRDRLKPFVTNCEAARMLRRLSAMSGEGEFERLSDETLAAIAPAAGSQGPLAAHYLLAVEESQK